MEHDQWVIKENILAIRQLMSDQNLQLLPDYEQRIQVLRELGFIDEGSRVELKGKVACEVGSCTLLTPPLTDPWLLDPLRRRTRPHRAGPRERPRRIRTRRNRCTPLRIRLPREDRYRAHLNRLARTRCRQDRRDLRKGQQGSD